MIRSRTIHHLLTDHARALVAGVLRAREAAPGLVVVVAIDSCAAASENPPEEPACVVKVIPWQQVIRVYGHLLRPEDVVELGRCRPLSEIVVVVSAGDEVAVGVMATGSEGTSAADVGGAPM